jgi:hypothetical protein
MNNTATVMAMLAVTMNPIGYMQHVHARYKLVEFYTDARGVRRRLSWPAYARPHLELMRVASEKLLRATEGRS